jgi:hypothetical protein
MTEPLLGWEIHYEPDDCAYDVRVRRSKHVWLRCANYRRAFAALNVLIRADYWAEMYEEERYEEHDVARSFVAARLIARKYKRRRDGK